jgi:hypothetical protein
MRFANFYYYIIKNFSKLANSLTDTTVEQFNGKNWQWSELSKKLFQVLTQRFTRVPVLVYHDSKLHIMIEIVASNFSIDALLFQLEESL